MTNTSLNIWKFRVRFREFPENRILARYTEIFHSIRISPQNFQNDRLKGSLFENSKISGFSRNSLSKLAYHLSPFRFIRNIWLNEKRPHFHLDPFRHGKMSTRKWQMKRILSSYYNNDTSQSIDIHVVLISRFFGKNECQRVVRPGFKSWINTSI